MEYADRRIQVVITNMPRLEIPPIKEALGLGPEFMTCRNFQFGWAHLREKRTVNAAGLFGG